ncbi:hypothetical protein BX661DRAFT_181666 [Kickxella alabastrina]|uniref:uncharacterized protein n=1 Tax=Kickxella alabastrina TaxID=61397 RepID=UPI002220E682|nr:uncharacterized protein BX661DRAFT_181666 [Kickxella alabastrina]KAI7829266.1 hypothetical protein BX661DRAFT_181666 [Kickxella alabastrina]
MGVRTWRAATRDMLAASPMPRAPPSNDTVVAGVTGALKYSAAPSDDDRGANTGDMAAGPGPGAPDPAPAPAPAPDPDPDPASDRRGALLLRLVIIRATAGNSAALGCTSRRSRSRRISWIISYERSAWRCSPRSTAAPSCACRAACSACAARVCVSAARMPTRRAAPIPAVCRSHTAATRTAMCSRKLKHRPVSSVSSRLSCSAVGSMYRGPLWKSPESRLFDGAKTGPEPRELVQSVQVCVQPRRQLHAAEHRDDALLRRLCSAARTADLLLLVVAAIRQRARRPGVLDHPRMLILGKLIRVLPLATAAPPPTIDSSEMRLSLAAPECIYGLAPNPPMALVAVAIDGLWKLLSLKLLPLIPCDNRDRAVDGRAVAGRGRGGAAKSIPPRA